MQHTKCNHAGIWVILAVFLSIALFAFCSSPAETPSVAIPNQVTAPPLPKVDPVLVTAHNEVALPQAKTTTAGTRSVKKVPVSWKEAENAAYRKAAYNAARAECLRWAVDMKVDAENARGTGIRDWGNVREQPVCADYIYVAPSDGAKTPGTK